MPRSPNHSKNSMSGLLDEITVDGMGVVDID
jgi:hypothetical protein